MSGGVTQLQPIAYAPPTSVATGTDQVPQSPRGHLSSRFRPPVNDDSPSSKTPHYTVLSSPSSHHHHGGFAPQQPQSFLHAYSYGDIPLGMEKVSRSKVLPNEVCRQIHFLSLLTAFGKCCNLLCNLMKKRNLIQ